MYLMAVSRRCAADESCCHAFCTADFLVRKKSSEIKWKERISKRRYQENKRQIFGKTNISNPLIRILTCAYQGIRNVRFTENMACFDFLLPPFGGSPFCLITAEVRKYSNHKYLNNFNKSYSIVLSCFVLFVCSKCVKLWICFVLFALHDRGIFTRSN